MNKGTGIAIGIIVLVLIAVGVFAIGNNDSDNTADNNSQSTTESQANTESATPSDSEEKKEMLENSDVTVDLVGSNFEFSQNEITAKPGDTVTINYSVDGGSHDFVIDELNVQSEVLGSSDSATITFTVPEDAAGETYSFYCSIGNHRAQGMEGQLVITE
jgi:plastocyanin